MAGVLRRIWLSAPPAGRNLRETLAGVRVVIDAGPR